MNFFHLGQEFTSLNPFLIAEVGVNHEGSIENAKELIRLAAGAGAHAVKFQSYKASKLASELHSKAYWDTSFEQTLSQFELFSKYDVFEPEDYRLLADYCAECGVEFLSTPFDEGAVEFLSFQSAMKIASADLTNVPLRRKVASLGKPILLSTGAAQISEIRDALHDLRKNGADSITLLHCVLRYPTEAHLANLRRITTLQEEFGEEVSIGYSDHVRLSSGGISQLMVALELGACVIEKHFTADKSLPGNDHYHAMDVTDLRSFVSHIAERQMLLAGNGADDLTSQLRARTNARRRLFFTARLAAGTVITEEMVTPLRGDIGLEVSSWDSVIGRTLRSPVEKHTPVDLAHFS